MTCGFSRFFVCRRGLARCLAALGFLLLLVLLGLCPLCASPSLAEVPSDHVADPDTSDSYIRSLLGGGTEGSNGSGTENAGRMWADKSVFAKGVDGKAEINLDVETDGVKATISSDADFLHEFSALGSTQRLSYTPVSPIDMMIAIDMSASMAQSTEWPVGAEGSGQMSDGTYMETMAERIDHSRIQRTLDAVNGIIDRLAEQNPQNRVGVVVYGAGVDAVLPLAHYKRAADNRPVLSVGGIESLYALDDVRFIDGEWRWVRNRDATFTICARGARNDCTADLADPASPKNSWTLWERSVSNNVDNDKAQAKPGLSVQDSVSLSQGDTGATTRLSADAYVGYFTNTQAGIFCAYDELARSDATSYSETFIDGEVSTVARVPAVVVMSDGGANFAFNEMETWDKNYGAYDESYRSQWNPVPFITDEVTDPTDLSHRIGAGKNTGDEWYRVYIPGWTDDHRVTSLYNEALELGNPGLTTPPEWNYAGIFYSNDSNEISTSGTILESVTTAAYMRSAANAHYEKGWEAASAAHKGDLALRTFTMSVDGESVPRWGRLRLYPTMDPEEYLLPVNSWDDACWAELLADEFSGTGTFGDNVEYIKTVLKGTADNWTKFAGGSDITPIMGHGMDIVGLIKRLPDDGYVDGRYGVTVTNDDVAANVVWTDGFYDVSSSGVSGVFDDIFAKVTSDVFVPASGDNTVGVKDSMTYRDPIGEYMDVSDVENVVLFGTLYGVRKTAVYDFSWNEAYLAQVGRAGGEFSPGFYRGDAESGFEGPYDLPPGCADADAAWGAGWTYRVGYATAQDFVPTLAKTDLDHMTDEQRNTVYDLYRIDSIEAGLDPFTGRDVEGAPVAVSTGAVDHGSQTDLLNSSYGEDANITYRLGDIRIWVEDRGDWESAGDDLVVDSSWEEALWVNLPAEAMPVQVVSVDLSSGGRVMDHRTNLGAEAEGDTGAAYAASTPFRVVYDVSLSPDIVYADGSVNLARVSTDYISTHKEDGRVKFLSNWWSESTWDGWAQVGEQTLGDPALTVSPSLENRFYVYQTPAMVFRLSAEPLADSALRRGLVLGNVADGAVAGALSSALSAEGLSADVVDDFSDLSSSAWYVVIDEYYDDVGGGQWGLVCEAVLRHGDEFGSAEVTEDGWGAFLAWYDPDTKAWSSLSAENPYARGEVRTRPGTDRSGDLHQAIRVKSASPTKTAGNASVPRVHQATADSDMMIDLYLGNDGALTVADSQVAVTKETTEDAGGETFDFQAYIEGVTGDVDAIEIYKNPLTGLWQRRVSTVDVVLDHGHHLVDDTGAHIVVSHDGRDCYVGLPTESENVFTRRVWDAGAPSALSHAGMTVYVEASSLAGIDAPAGVELAPADGSHPVGLSEFWVDDAWLVAADDVDGAHVAEGERVVVARLSAVDDADLTSATDVGGECRIRAAYMTRTLTFGSDEAWAGDVVDVPADGVGGSGERTITDSVAANTATFTLESDTGLLFRGLEEGSAYRMSERLEVPDAPREGDTWWVLDSAENVRQTTYIDYDDTGDVTSWGTHDGTSRTPGVAADATGASMVVDVPVASVSGEAGPREESVRFTNRPHVAKTSVSLPSTGRDGVGPWVVCGGLLSLAALVAWRLVVLRRRAAF